MASKYAACVAQVTEAKDQELLDFCARRLVEMAAYTIMGHLMVQDASKNAELFGTSAQVFVRYAESEVEKHINFIRKFGKPILSNIKMPGLINKPGIFHIKQVISFRLSCFFSPFRFFQLMLSINKKLVTERVHFPTHPLHSLQKMMDSIDTFHIDR